MSNDSEQPPDKNARGNDYPSSPGADESPQEPVSEDESTESGQQEESEQEHSGGEESDDAGEGAEANGNVESSGAAVSGKEEPEGTPESYPSDPEETKTDPPSGSGDGPGAAKASEPHERQPRSNVPPPPSRPPSNSGTNPQDPEHSPSPYGPDPPTSAWQSAPYQDPPSTRPRKKASKAPLFLGIGVAAALILGVVLIATMLSGPGETEAEPAAGSNGIIAEEVSPFDFEEGQCFTDFSNATEPATVVTCETPHKAQLVNTFYYEEDAEFPGEEALAQKAQELCRNTQLSGEANQYEGQLRQQTAYPQAESWEEGDRRVDCFIRITTGEITGSLID